MTREEALRELKIFSGTTRIRLSANFWEALNMAIKALEQEPCEDAISRKSIKQKLQEHHDFFVNAYGGFSNLPQNDKSRVDEITNCIAMVVNEPPVTPQYTDAEIQKAYELGKEDKIKVLDKIRAEMEKQEKWLMSAGYNAYNVDIAFSSIKKVRSRWMNLL